MFDSGASYSVLNYPTYLTLAKLLNITCNDKTNHTSKTLTVANQTEVPMLHYFKHQPNTNKFTSLLPKDYPYFSYIYRINSKTQIRLNSNSSKIAHFPIKNYYNLHFVTTPKNQFFPTIPHTYFSTKFRKTFNFIEIFTDDKPDICSTIIQSSTNHIATLPKGHIGYIEVSITDEQPKYYQVNDINSLVHNVVHTYHPEPLPSSN